MKSGEYRLSFRGDIEGLRGLAILLVVGAHAGIPWLAGGFVGVDVFLVLSGFLITGVLFQELTATGTLSFGDFYIRRLRRLMPSLILMVIVTSVIAVIVVAPAEQLQLPGTVSMVVLWASNFHFALADIDYFASGMDRNLFLHTWSLGVEEQFYLIWPAVLLVAYRGQMDRRLGRLRWLMSAVIVSGLIASWWLTPKFPQWAFYMMPVRSWEFATGALIWLAVQGQERNHEASQTAPAGSYIAGFLGLGAVIGSAFVYSDTTTYPGWHAAIPVMGAAAMIWAGSRAGVGVSSLLTARPLQWLGRISYAWYLWHWPALLLGTAVANSDDPWVRVTAVLVSLALALGSYRWVEYLTRRQSWWLVHRRLAWWGAIVSIIFVSLLAMQWFSWTTSRLDAPGMQRLTRAYRDLPSIYAAGKNCDDYYSSSAVRPCVFGRADAPHTAVLMGDSVAGQWFPAVAKLFVKSDWRLVVLTKSACPMVDAPTFLVRLGRPYTECEQWRPLALAKIESLHPDIVILSTAANYKFNQTEWIEGTSRVLNHISGSSGRVVFLRSTPHLSFDGPNCLAARAGRPQWLMDTNACHSPSGDVQEDKVLGWLRQSAAPLANVSIIDMNDVVCPGGICAAELGDLVVFRDTQHMTASFVTSLWPELAHRIGGIQQGFSDVSPTKSSP